MAIVALAVVFVTAEYKWGAIRTSLAASPRRGRLLAAKALVIGAATFAAGVAAGLGAFLLSAPMLRSNGVTPASLADGPVLRAVAGTGALMAAVAVFSLGVAVILRRSAASITVVLLLLLIPQLVGRGLPLSVAMWLERLTPAAGFAIQQTVDRYDTAIGPWAGLGVLCGYAAATLAAALWLLRRRDA
jgi:ABC-type transport system involved in multi-copper enzyme maturation permease subunit